MDKEFFDRNPRHKKLKEEIDWALKLSDKDFSEFIHDCLNDDDFIPIPEEILHNGHKMSEDEYMKYVMKHVNDRALNDIDIELTKIELIVGNIRDNQGTIDYYNAKEIIDSLAKVRIDFMSRWRRT